MLRCALYYSFILTIAVSTSVRFSQLSAPQLYLDERLLANKLQNITSLIIDYAAYSQAIIAKVLQTQMDHLREITFQKYHFDRSSPSTEASHLPRKQFASQKIIKAIFSSQYFGKLKQLNLIATNLDDRSFSFLEGSAWRQPRSLEIEVLKLGGNYIGQKGFISLSRLQWPKLREIDVSGNLLISQESVDALIKIICHKQPSFTHKCALQSLDISSTSITIEGFHRIIAAIDPSRLKHLNISNNNLHQAKRYQEPSNLTAYQLLSSMNFSQLLSLQMNDVGLDSHLLTLFHKWRFPKLTSLVLFMNYIDDDSLKLWLTKQNFPALQRLILYNNFIGDGFLAHLQRDGFRFKELNVGFNTIGLQGLNSISRFESKTLMKLYLKGLKLQTKYLQQFFRDFDQPQLRQLSFSGNSQISDIFEHFPWIKMPKLQKLVLTDCNLQDSISKLSSSPSILAPNLKSLFLNNTGLNERIAVQLLKNIRIIFPKLLFIDMIHNHWIGVNISALAQLSMPDGLYIDLGYISVRKNGQENKIEVDTLQSLGTVALVSVTSDLLDYFERPQKLAIKQAQKIDETKVMKAELIEQVSTSLCKSIDFSQLYSLTISKTHQFQLMFGILDHCQIQLSRLESLSILYQTSIEKVLALLRKQRMLHLRELRAVLIVDQHETLLPQLVSQLKRFRAMTNLKLHFKFDKASKGRYNYNQYLNMLTFPFLQSLDLSDSQLEPQEIGGILHNNAPSLRNLHLRNNFLQKSFLRMISQKKLVLTHLDLSFISFTIEEFAWLGRVELSFLRSLNIESCDLTTEHLLIFLQQSNRTLAFAKLASLNLNDNDIKQNATVALFETGLSQLSFLKIKHNNNPNYVNIALSYNTKLLQILAIGTNTYALSPDIHPTSARRVRILAITTDDFSETDFQIIGSLQFHKLLFSQIYAKEVYNCNFYKTILNINRFVSKTVLFIDNHFQILNSSCLTYDHSFANYQSQVQQLIISDKHYTTFAPQMVTLLLRSERNLKNLMLHQTKLPPSVFLSIPVVRLKHIQIINLAKNYMNDDAFSWFLQSPLSNLKFLDVSDNELSIASVANLKSRQFHNLQEINLSGLSIGDEGLQILSTMRLPQLKRLFLMRCQIRQMKGLKGFKFANLNTIGLQNNRLTFQAVFEALLMLNRGDLPALKNLSLRGLKINEQERDKILRKGKELQLRIELDQPYHIKMTNAANV